MSYTSWSVVFGEQPTAAKWNQLGQNDAGFKDGTNIDAGAITDAKINTSARSTWAPTWYKNDHVTALSPTDVITRYRQRGKEVNGVVVVGATGNPSATGATHIWLTAPVAYKTESQLQVFGTGRAYNGAPTVCYIGADNAVASLLFISLLASANWASDNSIEVPFSYEAA